MTVAHKYEKTEIFERYEQKHTHHLSLHHRKMGTMVDGHNEYTAVQMYVYYELISFYAKTPQRSFRCHIAVIWLHELSRVFQKKSEILYSLVTLLILRTHIIICIYMSQRSLPAIELVLIVFFSV